MAKNVNNNDTLEVLRTSYNDLVDEVGGLGGLRTSQKTSLVDSINSIIDQYFFFQDFEYDGSDGTGSNRTFSGADNFGETLNYSVNRLLVFKNGTLLRSGTDYNASNGTSVVLTSSAANSDIIRITSFTGSYEGVAGATQAATTQWTKTGGGSIFNHDTESGVVINSDDSGIVTTPASGVGVQIESSGSNIFLNTGGTSNKVEVNGNLNLVTGGKITVNDGNVGLSNFEGLQAAVRGALSASGDISYNSSTGVISFSQAGAPVTSVFGRTGAVGLTLSDVTGVMPNTGSLSEGSNLYFTNERVDDRVNALLTDATTSGIDISYDDAGNELTLSVDLSEIVESLQDNVQGLFSGGTGITTSYDDNANSLSLSIDFSEFDTDNLVEGSTNLFYTEARFDSSLSGKTTANLTEGANLYFTDERAQDAVGGMFTGNTETLIQATYDDTNAKINLVVDNDLANYDNSTSGFITATLTQEQVEDFVGGMLDGTATLISVTYDDTDGNIDFVVDNDLANYSNTNSAFITLASLSGGTGVTYNNGTGAISIGQAVGTSDNVTFNNLVLDGNLTVNGTTTAVESTTVTINDPMVRYADNNTGNSVDFGFYGKYVQSSTTKFGGLVWDASQTDKFRLFHGLQTEPTTTVDISATGHTVGTLIANLEGNVTGNVTGNVSGTSGSTTGNAATATALASAQNFSLTGDVTASAISFDGSGAVALATTISSGAVDFAMIADTIDEDNMASDSATKIPTQQSVKAYVDSQLTAQDLDFQADSGGALSIDLDSETFTISGTSNEIETSGSGNTVTIGLPSATEITTSLGVGGGSTNGVVIEQGSIKIKNGGTQSAIDFYCESNNAHYARLQAPAHANFSGNPTITLPSTAGTLQLTEAAVDLNGNNLGFDTDGNDNSSLNAAAATAHRLTETQAFGSAVLWAGEAGAATAAQRINIISQRNASYSLVNLDKAISAVSEERAKYGAYISRLEHAGDNLTNVARHQEQSRSRIADADYAVETSELSRTTIIAQASTAMLAQANSSKQTVLALLRE
mgnify:CR=1 FL=1